MEKHNGHVVLLRAILSGEISDAFKEINGFRPRCYDYQNDPVTDLMAEASKLWNWAIEETKEREYFERAEVERMEKLNRELHSLPPNSMFGDALKAVLK